MLTSLQLSTLKTEIDTDPKGLGYASLLPATQDQAIANLLNANSGNGAATVTVISLSKDDFLIGILPAISALNTASSTIQSKYTPLLDVVKSTVNVNISDVSSILAGMVSDGLLTQAQVDAFTQYTGTRAEVLFGAGTVISSRDVATALGRTA